VITDYKDRKLIEYLKPGGKYLIRFGHGLGDTLMFMPAFYKLQKLYPKSQIDIYLECGQEEIFDSVSDKDGEGYDEVFHLDFPMVEGGKGTKTQKCCKEELGIDPWALPDSAWLPDKESPLVACHFQGTALPDSVNCPPGIAQQIWQEIITAGKIPIEVHFKHVFHNPRNEKYGFVNRHVRDCQADLHNLIGLLQRSFAFVGVASGPFVCALSIMPERILYLERHHKLESYCRHSQRVQRLSINNGYKQGMVMEWLKTLSNSDIPAGVRAA